MTGLYPFQREGREFLATRRRALLADEQGIGKTPQAICAADECGAFDILIICKAIARTNWMREWLRWSVAPDRHRFCLLPQDGVEAARHANIVIVSYDAVHRPDILKCLLQRTWDLVICDEEQFLKSAYRFWHDEEGKNVPRRAEAVLHPKLGLALRADMTWGLSGTPAPNHIGELYGWLRSLHPELVANWPTYRSFLQHFTRSRETPYGVQVTGNRNTEELRSLLSGVMLRRKRVDVLPDLPDLQINDVVLSVDDIPKELKALEFHREAVKVGEVLESLEPDEADPEALLNIGGMDPSTLRRLTGLAKAEAAALKIAEELDATDNRIVVMCWHRDTIALLSEMLASYGAVRVYGFMTEKQKQKSVDAFQRGGIDCRVLVANIQTAGTSITLTSANRMVIVEPSYVPGDNEQAILRILRIGQTRACSVDFMALGGSIDEQIMGAYSRKARLLAEVLS